MYLQYLQICNFCVIMKLLLTLEIKNTLLYFKLPIAFAYSGDKLNGQ